MFVLVTGGAASGKSAYAENLLLRSPASPKCYLATMLAQDAESRARVERHRAMRKGKGFLTLECPLLWRRLLFQRIPLYCWNACPTSWQMNAFVRKGQGNMRRKLFCGDRTPLFRGGGHRRRFQ